MRIKIDMPRINEYFTGLIKVEPKQSVLDTAVLWTDALVTFFLLVCPLTTTLVAIGHSLKMGFGVLGILALVPIGIGAEIWALHTMTEYLDEQEKEGRS